MRDPGPIPVAETVRVASTGPTESRWQNALSVTMMAGIAFLPIVIAAGFLAEHLGTPSAPSEVSMAALRGPLDADPQAAGDRSTVERRTKRLSIPGGAGF